MRLKKVAIPSEINAVETLPRFKKKRRCENTQKTRVAATVEMHVLIGHNRF